MTHLSPRALKGLKQYQYKSGGYTLLDGFHTPIWNGKSSQTCLLLGLSSLHPCAPSLPSRFTGVVELLPLWLAPNLITLIGVSALVLAYVVTLSYLPGLAGIAIDCSPCHADLVKSS